MVGLLILGVGGHARVVLEAALLSGREIEGLIDINYNNQKESILSVDVLGGEDVLGNYVAAETTIIVAIGDNNKRREWYIKLKEIGFLMTTIVHPAALVSPSSKIGSGVFINAGAIINAEASVGDNVIINTGVVVDHEVNICAHVHLAPGVLVGGRSVITDNTFVGIGASIADKVKIGENVIIGAGSTIVKDVSSGLTVVGVGKVI